MKSICRLFIILVLISLSLGGLFTSSGCASRKAESEEGYVEYTIPPAAKTIPQPVVEESLPVNETQMRPSKQISETQKTERAIWGWRVELFSSSDRLQSEQKAREAAELFKEESVYVQFDHPYYKVRVGNFTDRKEAEKLLSKARRSGFSSANVVKAMIIPQRR